MVKDLTSYDVPASEGGGGREGELQQGHAQIGHQEVAQEETFHENSCYVMTYSCIIPTSRVHHSVP